MLADDLVQDTLAKALSKTHQLREVEKLRPWLFTILGNCWREYLRKSRDFRELEENTLTCTNCPEQRFEQDSTVSRVREAVMRLPVDQREVVTLVDLNEFSYLDAADILGIPKGTVMSRLSRGRKALLTHLDESALRKSVGKKHLRSVV
jgi:RNA polymerase sigma-70 factor (ECF subfamily)